MAHTDVIVVGAGLSGLVAAAELADAGRRVLLVDQESAANLGGQAFWSFGGLFLVDSPEQRRMGIRDSVDLAWQDWEGTAGFDRRRRGPLGRGGGPAPTSTSPPGRSGPGCASRACGSSRSWAGPSAATGAPAGTATRCRGSTSPGAPGPGVLEPFVRRVREAVAAGPVSSAVPPPGGRAGHRRAAPSRASAAAVLAPGAASRGRAHQPRGRRRVRAARAGRGRHLRRHRRRTTTWSGRAGPARLGTPPARDGHRGPRLRRRPDARHHRGRRRPAGQPRPDVALRRGHAELGPDLARPRHPHPARPVLAVVRRDRDAAAGAAVPRLRHPGHAGPPARPPATTTAGSSSPRRSSRRSSRCRARSRTRT